MKILKNNKSLIITTILLVILCFFVINYLSLPILADSAGCSSGSCKCSCKGTNCGCESGGGSCSCWCDEIGHECYPR